MTSWLGCCLTISESGLCACSPLRIEASKEEPPRVLVLTGSATGWAGDGCVDVVAGIAATIGSGAFFSAGVSAAVCTDC